VIQHSLDEISFKALPEDLVDRIEVDIADMEIGDLITVADLPFASNKSIEILTSLDSVVVSVTAPKEFVEETTESESISTDVDTTVSSEPEGNAEEA
jgi:large subunit ribosomal protein L25